MGRHAKPPGSKEPVQETQKETEERQPSKGRHAKDRQPRKPMGVPADS